MKKLKSLRQFIIDAVPALKRSPDRLLSAIPEGSAHHNVRAQHNSFEYRYNATLMVLDFVGDPNTIVLPVIYWMKKNQPDMNNEDARVLDFSVDMLNNNASDVTITIALTEFVRVEELPNNQLKAEHMDEAIYVGHGQHLPATYEWQQHPSGEPVNNT